MGASCSPERVAGWVEYAVLQEELLANAAGLVVGMLRAGKAPPELTPGQERALERKLRQWELQGRSVGGD